MPAACQMVSEPCRLLNHPGRGAFSLQTKNVECRLNLLSIGQTRRGVYAAIDACPTLRCHAFRTHHAFPFFAALVGFGVEGSSNVLRYSPPIFASFFFARGDMDDSSNARNCARSKLASFFFVRGEKSGMIKLFFASVGFLVFFATLAASARSAFSSVGCLSRYRFCFSAGVSAVMIIAPL
jgi:hypothetical protein